MSTTAIKYDMAGDPSIRLIRLKSIGDVLFTLPAVHVVRQNFPGAKITFLTSRENASLLEGFREGDEVITLDRARFQSGNQCGDFNPRKTKKTNYNLKLLVPHPGIWLKLHA